MQWLQSLRCLYLIWVFQNGRYWKLAYFGDVLLYKYKQWRGNKMAESWNHSWTVLSRFPGRFHCILRTFLAPLLEVPTSPFLSSCRCNWKENHTFFIFKETLWVTQLVLLPLLQKHHTNNTNRISVKLI